MQLKIEHIAKQYRRGQWGLRDISLQLSPGVVGLLGPNGAGKTTLMNILATITRPSAGRVLWNDTDIAATPVSRPQYLLGKWLSNTAVLGILLLALSGMAVVMQLWRGEVTAVQPIPLLAPLWLLGLPVMALVAVLALLFEAVPLLAGGIGNLLYFFGWLFFLNNVMLPGLFRVQVGWISPGADVLGITRPIAARQAFAVTVEPAYNGHFNIAGASYGRMPSLVVWDGLDWTVAIAAERLAWLLAAIGLALLTALIFDRFDPAHWSAPIKLGHKPAIVLPVEETDEQPRLPVTALAPPAESAGRPSLLALVRAELALLVHGRSRWLLAAAVVATLFSLVAPPGEGPPVAALVWLWPVLLWSELGTRTRTYGTHTLVYAAPQPRRRSFGQPGWREWRWRWRPRPFLACAHWPAVRSRSGWLCWSACCLPLRWRWLAACGAATAVSSRWFICWSGLWPPAAIAGWTLWPFRRKRPCLAYRCFIWRRPLLLSGWPGWRRLETGDSRLEIRDSQSPRA